MIYTINENTLDKTSQVVEKISEEQRWKTKMQILVRVDHVIMILFQNFNEHIFHQVLKQKKGIAWQKVLLISLKTNKNKQNFL